MPITLEWHDIALRLTLTFAAGVPFGVNRSERGRAAGLASRPLGNVVAHGAIDKLSAWTNRIWRFKS